MLPDGPAGHLHPMNLSANVEQDVPSPEPAPAVPPTAEVAAKPKPAEPGPGPRLLLPARPVRAAPRVYVSASHLEQLFGHGHPLTQVWSGLLGEPMFLERVNVCGAQRREVKARVCASPVSTTTIVLPTAALLALDIRNAPPVGKGEGVGGALSGPHGAVVFSSGVFRATARVVMGSALAKKHHVVEGHRYDLGLMGSPEVVEHGIKVEILPHLEGAWVMLDNPAWDRLTDVGAPVTVRLTELNPQEGTVTAGMA